MEHEVRRDDERNRYELVLDGEVVGIADFIERDSVVILPHTEIDARRRGNGLGAILVQSVLDDVRARGQTVVPSCGYVREFIDEHPHEADLLAG